MPIDVTPSPITIEVIVDSFSYQGALLESAKSSISPLPLIVKTPSAVTFHETLFVELPVPTALQSPESLMPASTEGNDDIGNAKNAAKQTEQAPLNVLFTSIKTTPLHTLSFSN